MKKELILLALVACTKGAAPAANEAVDAAPPLQLPQAAPVLSVPSVASPSPSAPSTALALPAASVRAVPSGRSVSPVADPLGKPMFQPASAKVTGNHFALDVASLGCVVGSECAVTVRLEATGGYHINKEYPYKLLLSPTPNVEFLGRDPGNAATFSKAAGDFVVAEEHVATITARLKPSAKGTASITGIYKMSVCSEANCQVEQTKIALDLAIQ